MSSSKSKLNLIYDRAAQVNIVLAGLMILCVFIGALNLGAYWYAHQLCHLQDALGCLRKSHYLMSTAWFGGILAALLVVTGVVNFMVYIHGSVMPLGPSQKDRRGR